LIDQAALIRREIAPALRRYGAGEPEQSLVARSAVRDPNLRPLDSILASSRARSDGLNNRILECAFAADAEFIVTVNTALGHFDRKRYQSVHVVRPSEFLNVPDVGDW
jgi:hypothetical protein